MQTGKETWKWGVVVLLLAIFLITANHAYEHLSTQEDYAPPDDYTKGDSWDIEHQRSQGSGQSTQLYVGLEQPSGSDNSAAVNKKLSSEEIVIEDDIDWGLADNLQSSDTKDISNKKEE